MPSEPEWRFECDRDNPDAAEAFAGYLDELERLCNAATPGPWTSHQGSIWSASSRNPICDIDAGSPDEYDPDARFIETARHALPKLIAFVRTADLDGAASLDAFDAIATMLGCAEWEYPGQLVRDVQALKERADRLEVQLNELLRSLEQSRREPPWNWREYVGYLLDHYAERNEVQR